MFLDDDELIELTHRRRNAAQVRVLTGMGIEHRQRPDGSVAVLRAHVEKLFGDSVVSKPRRKTQPDWDTPLPHAA